ncbi:MAG: PCI domain-containing protein [Clostridiales bacterium]|jgi:hypothetical protein|nr:PCI domain-containing protein [Clostridiales bacterium]
MDKQGGRWGWIVFWLIIFWPIGLFLLIRKFATDKQALMSGKTTALSTIAWFLMGIGGIGVILMLSASGNIGGAARGGILYLVMFIGGISLHRKASKAKKTAEKYKKYIDIVVNQNTKSVDYIASAVGLPYDAVTKDLQDMINIGYLNAYIHQGNREIVLQRHEPAQYAPVPAPGAAAPRTIAARCPGCGANNVIAVGGVSECEYCGTPLSA